MAAPHAAAGPNMKEQTTGIALAGRNSVTPGINGTTLNGTSTAAYSAAAIALSTTILVLLHIERSSFIEAQSPRPARNLDTHKYRPNALIASTCQYAKGKFSIQLPFLHSRPPAVRLSPDR